MAQMTGRTMRGVDNIDQWMYSQVVPRGQKFWTYANRGFGEALAFGTGRSMTHFASAMREASGAGYLGALSKHYAGVGPITINPAWDKYFSTLHSGGKFARTRATAGLIGRRGASAAGVLVRGLAPATLLYLAGQDEMGFGIGLARETAAWGGFAMGGSIGLQMGGFAAASTGSAAGGGIGWALGKIPGVKKAAAVGVGRTLGRAAGAFVGGPVGFILGGFAMMEAARWGVGMALHTLPTFAKQFRHDMTTSSYGGDYTDSAGAITMRQRSLQTMGRSHVNARSALGQEASLLHV